MESFGKTAYIQLERKHRNRMAMIVKTDYTDAVKNVLRTVEGPLSVQPLFNVVIHP
jgi:hypothetical protein